MATQSKALRSRQHDKVLAIRDWCEKYSREDLLKAEEVCAYQIVELADELNIINLKLKQALNEGR